MASLPQFRCSTCEDRGWVVAADERGIVRARPCECARRQAPDLAYGTARIPERYRDCTLENFSDLRNPSLSAAKRAAEDLVRDYPQNDAGLLFSGPCGSGKTHLAVGALKALIQKFRVDASYVDCALLIRQLQDSFNADELSRPEILRPVETADVVLLDDLGGSKASEWVRETLAAVVNSRYNSRRLTLVTTRFPDDPATAGEPTLELQVGSSVRSRLWEMCRTVTLEADDFRRHVKLAHG